MMSAYKSPFSQFKALNVLLSILFFSSSVGYATTRLDVDWARATPIKNCHELQNIKKALWKSYKLSNDIDCSVIKNFQPIGDFDQSFQGNLNGNGYTISNLTINAPEQHGVGLFGVVDNEGLITNVKLYNVKIHGSSSVGGLAGTLRFGALITDVEIQGMISGEEFSVGGLVGATRCGGIQNSHTNVNVSQLNWRAAGGLVGELACYNAGQLNYIQGSSAKGRVEGTEAVGGLVGVIGKSEIIESYSTADVRGSKNSVGGLVGDATNGDVLIDQSYATGLVIGIRNVGGIIGNIVSERVIIKESYAVGKVQGAGAGGLVGYSQYDFTILSSYWDMDTTGQRRSWASKGEGKHTPDMKRQSTYIGWDFNNVWKIDQMNNGYPNFQWQASDRD